MKKLMIAAAAAAMIGGANAAPGDPLIYQATFNLKTTVGTATKDTSTYNLGWDGVSDFWYSDASLSNYFDTSTSPITIKDTTNFVLKAKGGGKFPVLTAAGLKNETIMTNLVALANSGAYDEKSAGQWCLTFKYTDEVCYRAAGTIKIDGYFVDDECFSAVLGQATDSDTTSFVDAFGGATLAKSKKGEVFVDDIAGAIPGLLKKNMTDTIDVIDSKKGDRTINLLYIAGHGTYGKVYDDDDKTRPGFTAFSGNAVGTADLPVCVSCCAPSVPVETWNCCSVITETAVFGTFSIKHNSSMTKKELY